MIDDVIRYTCFELVDLDDIGMKGCHAPGIILFQINQIIIFHAAVGDFLIYGVVDGAGCQIYRAGIGIIPYDRTQLGIQKEKGKQNTQKQDQEPEKIVIPSVSDPVGQPRQPSGPYHLATPITAALDVDSHNSNLCGENDKYGKFRGNFCRNWLAGGNVNEKTPEARLTVPPA